MHLITSLYGYARHHMRNGKKKYSMSNLGNIQLPEAQQSECRELEDASSLLKSW